MAEPFWRRVPIVFDAVIAIACYLMTVALPVKASAMLGPKLFGFAALASLPLLWRRRYPVTVVALVGAGTIGLAATGAQDFIPLPYGQLVATYTLAAAAPPLGRLVAGLGTGIGVFVTVVVLMARGPSVLATAGLPFVVAYAMGTGVRARRDRIAMLEERAARLAEEREMAAGHERERIAREIHDIVAHSVSLMVVQAEAGAVLAADPDRAGAAFDTISATGRQAVAQLDRALGVLRGEPPARHPAPGLEDLPALVERARSAGLEASLVVVGQARPVPADLAAAVYRIAQEALTNTVKHARAKRVEISVAWRDVLVALEVRDDGRGPDGLGTSGRGLVGMRERVRAFDGALEVGPGTDGIGFRVKASIPLASDG